MKTKPALVFIGIFSLSVVHFILFCGDPSKPDFELPPTIENGGVILTVGNEEYGASYFMYLNVSGTHPFGFQWYLDNSAMTGQTNGTLSFAALSYADTGVYHCIVTNDFGGDTSLTDTLRIAMGDSIPPTILNGKAVLNTDTAVIDSLYLMYIEAIGSDTLKYQWYKNDAAVSGAVNDTLTFPALAYADSGYYHCIVTNDFGADTSLKDTLSFIVVNNPPVWTVDIMHVSLHENVACTLTLSDSCTDPEGDSLIFILGTGNPAGDTIIGDAYLFTPAFNDSGAYSIVIQASDGSDYDTAVLALTVINVNRPPRFQPGLPEEDYYVPEDSILVVNFKAIDPDGDPVTYSLGLNELPHSDTIIFNDSQLVWKSHFDDSGYFNVEILATDGFESDTGSFLVSVGNVNRPPEVTIDTLDEGDTVKVTEMKTLSFTVTATDPDSGNVVYLTPGKNLPTNANYSTASGAFSYSPDFSVTNGLNSPYVFPNVTFYATDSVNAEGIDSFVIHIAVIDSNSAPVWTEDTVLLTVTEGSTLSYNFKALFAGDNEGEVVSFSKTFGSFNADTSQWSWTPDFNSSLGKNDTVCTITATDNHTPSASSELKLIITVSDSTPAVTLASPTHVAYNSIGLSWTQSSDADFNAYKIFYSTTTNVDETSTSGPIITTQLKTNDTITSLTEKTPYYIRVYVYNTNFSKAGSNEINATTSILGAPAIVINIPTVYNDSTSLYVSAPTISGTAGSDAGIASVTAKINGNGVSVTGTASWSFSAATAYTNKKAWNLIEITATDNASKFTTDSFYVYYKPDLAIPVKPTITDTTNRSISLSWSAITDCDRYLVYRSRDGINYIVVKDTTGTGYTDSPLDINTQYWYKIKGYYTAQGVSDTTDESPSNSTTTENWFEYVYDFDALSSWGYVFTLCKSNDGGYIIAGTLGNNNCLLMKITYSGDTLWSQQLGQNDFAEIYSIEETSDRGFIITGGANNPNNSDQGVFLLKTDSNGNKEWQRYYLGRYGAIALVTNDDGFIINSSSNNNEQCLIKANSSGDSLWARMFTYEPLGGVNSCVDGVIASDGGYLSLGFICNGGTLLSKVNTQGDSLWSQPYYLCGIDDTIIVPSSLVESDDDNYVISGSADVTGNCTLVKIHRTWKSILWRKEYNINVNSYTKSLSSTSDGGLIILGNSGGYINLVKTDAGGSEEWKSQLA